MEISSDPMLPFVELERPEEVVDVRLFASSIPFSERSVNQVWRRVVEQAYNAAELSDCLDALGTARAHGILTPAYTAAQETWTDTEVSASLYVGHVHGKPFTSLNLHDSRISYQYRVLGDNLLQYFDSCMRHNEIVLYDIASVEQYIYGVTGAMTAPEPVLVDLELHSGRGFVGDQLYVFMEEFIMPIEKSSGTAQTSLRAGLRGLAEKHISSSAAAIDRLRYEQVLQMVT